MTSEEIQKVVNEAVQAAMSAIMPKVENQQVVTPKVEPAEKLYRVGGLEEVAGSDGRVLRMPTPTKEDCTSVTAMINRGTQDILEHPNVDPEEAMRDANLLREIKEKRTKI